MHNNFLSLPVNETLSPSITLRQKGELDILVIDHPKLKASLALQGAHLLRWQPVDQKHVIWLSEKSLFKKGVAIRGGVPICWPWFGKVAQPAHGFARNMLWKLTEHKESKDGVFLMLTLQDCEESRKIWPHQFKLVARFTLGKECHVELESFGDYQATAALHSYFEIGDIEHVQVSGLGNVCNDRLTDRITDNEHNDSITFKNETDVIYTAPKATSVIHDKVLHRDIEICHQHHSDLVVWNPFEKVSANMVDMSSIGYQTMVCVETARINKPLVVTDTNPAKFAMTISVK